MDIAQGVVSFASAQAVVGLSNSFVSNIISPIVATVMSTAGLNQFEDYKIGQIAVGAFLMSLLQCVIILFIVFIIFKLCF